MAYDLKTAHAPRLVGFALTATVRLAENPLTRGWVLPQLLKTGGIPSLRAAVLEEAPLFIPSFPRPGATPTENPSSLAGRGESPEGQPSRGENAPPSSHPSAASTPFETAKDFVRAYHERRALPDEVIERFLDAEGQSNSAEPALRAIVATHPDEIRVAARASSERYRSGCPLGPLDGVPVAVKDELDVRGYATTGGTRFLKRVADQDSVSVARLRAAGAIIVAKTNMHEMGVDTTGFNVHLGTARNPYNVNCYTGGSSSGSAAAVASGLVPLAVGADGGGSIRIPASLCGVVGLKPTFGAVSTQGGAALCWSVSHVGPIGASVADVALGYSVMANHQSSPASMALALEQLKGGIEGLRLGIYRPWFEDADPEVARVTHDVLARLERHGAKLVDIELPDLDLCRVAHAVTILSEMATSVAPYLRRKRSDFGWGARLMMALASRFTARDYVRAQQVRARFTAHVEQALSVADVLVTPTTARTAPAIRGDVLPLGESDLEVTSALMRFAFPWNMTGHPALTFPAGYDAQGLPIGLQLAGAAWSEALLLRVAHQAEQWVDRRLPTQHYRLLG